MGRTLLFFLVTLLIVPSAWAQSEDPIITDRPDFTESPVSVSPGTIQIELGATAFDYDAGSLWNAGETLVRYGLFNKVEMRLQLPSAIGGDDLDSGLSDSGFGVKIHRFQPSRQTQIPRPRWQIHRVHLKTWSG